MQPIQPEGPLVLNFDDSIGAVKGAVCLDLQAWQEKIRFACSWRNFNAVSAFISNRLPQNYGTVLLGSGDYHHISYFLVKRLGEKLLRQQAAGEAGEANAAKAGLSVAQQTLPTGASDGVEFALLGKNRAGQRPPDASDSGAEAALPVKNRAEQQQAAGALDEAKMVKPRRPLPAALAGALPAQAPAGRGAAMLPEPAAAPRGGAQIQVVILDNHPDNMRYPFGIHCGSWVSHLAALPFVARIDVLGITSGDIALAHAWENRLLPLWRGKLHYWSVGVDTGWARWLGLARAFRNFAAAEDMAAAFMAEQAGRTMPVYLSLDKDVLAPAWVHTNWDQGVMEKETLIALLTALKNRIIASDIVGEVSEYCYKNPLKRLMSALDGQEPVPPAELASWQRANWAFNRQILPLLP